MAETDGIKQRKALLTTNQQIEHPHTGSSSKNTSADNTMASTSTSTSGT